MKKPLLLLTLAASLSATSLFAADTARLDELLHDSFTYRNLGPFRAGSWVSDVAVPENPLKAHLYTIYVAPRNGGIWKTTNNGVTFQSMFDQQPQGSMGAVAVAPSDENQVWAGTGDASCTRSATRGDGIYKSTDGGRTWQNMGLKDSQHIARIIVHPTNPEIVWVAATGHLFSTNEERGVFKTTDGGKSWKKVLYLNERTMAIDLVLNRKDVNTLYAAMYDCVRRPWTLEDGRRRQHLEETRRRPSHRHHRPHRHRSLREEPGNHLRHCGQPQSRHEHSRQRRHSRPRPRRWRRGPRRRRTLPFGGRWQFLAQNE
jgi:hypothetical protein